MGVGGDDVYAHPRPSQVRQSIRVGPVVQQLRFTATPSPRPKTSVPRQWGLVAERTCVIALPQRSCSSPSHRYVLPVHSTCDWLTVPCNRLQAYCFVCYSRQYLVSSSHLGPFSTTISRSCCSKYLEITLHDAPSWSRIIDVSILHKSFPVSVGGTELPVSQKLSSALQILRWRMRALKSPTQLEWDSVPRCGLVLTHAALSANHTQDFIRS